jgi:hypothetical protein
MSGRICGDFVFFNFKVRGLIRGFNAEIEAAKK